MGERIRPGFRLLMADDSPDDVFLVERALLRSGVSSNFYAVPNGREAIAYLQAEGKYANRQQFPFPNAVLMDLHMPGMDGFEVLRWLKNHPECKVIPTIIFSSSPVESDVHEVYVLGGNAYVTKPHDYNELVELIRLTYQFWSRCQVPQPPPGEKCG